MAATTRTFRSLGPTLVLGLGLTLVAACGVKADVVAGGSASATTTLPGAATTTTTAATTTTRGGAFTIPVITTGRGGTTPSTASGPTTTSTTVDSSGRRTPGGLTVQSFETELESKTQLSAAQAQCVAQTSFAQFTDGELDKIYSANDESSIPDLAAKFKQIVQTCVTDH